MERDLAIWHLNLPSDRTIPLLGLSMIEDLRMAGSTPLPLCMPLSRPPLPCWHWACPWGSSKIDACKRLKSACAFTGTCSLVMCLGPRGCPESIRTSTSQPTGGWEATWETLADSLPTTGHVNDLSWTLQLQLRCQLTSAAWVRTAEGQGCALPQLLTYRILN